MVDELVPGKSPELDFVAQKAMTDANTKANEYQVDQLVTTIKNATASDLQAEQSKAQAQSTIRSVADSAQLQLQAEDMAAQTRLGANPAAANFRLQQLADQQVDAYNKTNDLAKTIADKQSKTLLSDPLGFIQAQFSLPADIAQHNYYATIHNNAEAEYSNVVSSVTAEAQMNKATLATVTTASADAEQAKIAAESAQAQARITQTGAQLNIAGIRELQSLTDADLAHSATALNFKEQQVRIDLQRSQIAAANASRDLSNQLKIEQLNKNQLALEDQQYYANAYNKAQAKLGGATEPMAAVMAGLRRQDPKVLKMVRIGQDIITSGGTGEGVMIAPNPAEAGELYNGQRLIPTGTTAPVMKYLADKYGDLRADQAVNAEKDPAGKIALINTAIKADVAKQASKIEDGTNNIFAAPTIASLLVSVPALANNGFVANELAEKAKANPDIPTSTADILAAGIAAIKKDPSRLNEVTQGTANFFNAAIWSNNKLKGYAENGLDPQQSYPAAVPTGFMGRQQTVNVNNPVDVKAVYMMAALPVKTIVGKAGLTSGPVGGPAVFGLSSAAQAAGQAVYKKVTGN